MTSLFQQDARCFFESNSFNFHVISETDLFKDKAFETNNIENFNCVFQERTDEEEYFCQGDVIKGEFIGNVDLFVDLKKDQFEILSFQGEPVCFEEEKDIKVEIDGKDLKKIDCKCDKDDVCSLDVDDDIKFNMISLLEHFLECVEPTVAPTLFPTPAPTNFPTTANPTSFPIVPVPTLLPTVSPTTNPSMNPSLTPTINPTAHPTERPTLTPTINPTSHPTSSPSTAPTVNPTSHPTESPSSTPTINPTVHPTSSPSATPTVNPTSHPTGSPSPLPTQSPSQNPSVSPSKIPIAEPTQKPTIFPAVNPTLKPTTSPVVSLTLSPSLNPSSSPTESPSQPPSLNPSFLPTALPSQAPTSSPTRNPTNTPTINPTRNPTRNPTLNPTRNPTQNPTDNPTKIPTVSPTGNPTHSPTNSPTGSPTISPTVFPTLNPTTSPTISPTYSPTFNPTNEPLPVSSFFDSPSFIGVSGFLAGLLVLMCTVFVVAFKKKRKDPTVIDSSKSDFPLVRVKSFNETQLAVLDIADERTLAGFRSTISEKDQMKQVQVQKMLPDIEREMMTQNIMKAMSTLTFDNFDLGHKILNEKLLDKVKVYLATKVIKSSKRAASQHPLAPFDFTKKPKVSLKFYLSRLVFGLDNWFGRENEASVGMRCLLIAIVYMEYLPMLFPQFQISKLNVHKFLAIFMLAAAKLTEEEVVIDSYWANVSGYTEAHIVELEKIICFESEFTFEVNMKQLRQLVRILSDSEQEEASLLHYL